MKLKGALKNNSKCKLQTQIQNANFWCKFELETLCKLKKANPRGTTDRRNSLNQIAKAKSEIIKNIVPGGTMVINMDDKYYKYFIKKAENQKIQILCFSKTNKNADVLFLNQKKIF